MASKPWVDADQAGDGGKVESNSDMVCLRECRLVVEDGLRHPPEPFLGKVGKEGERVVLGTIPSILVLAWPTDAQQGGVRGCAR